MFTLTREPRSATSVGPSWPTEPIATSILRRRARVPRRCADRAARAIAALELRGEVQLRDGSPVEVRPLRADDKAGLAAGFARLSELSRYRRFLSLTTRLTNGQLAYLTELDHHDHEALVAID